VIIDPFYLAARGTKSSQLNDVGAHLEAIQLLVQEAGSALLVICHWNQTGSGTGSERFSGAGLEEWGRVLISASVEESQVVHPDDVTGRTEVVLKFQITGDEIGDTEVRLRRQIWTDDRDDLNSTMHYLVDETPEAVGGTGVDAKRNAALRKEEQIKIELSAAAEQRNGQWIPKDQLAARCTLGDMPLRRACIDDMYADGYLDRRKGDHNSQLHTFLRPYTGGTEDVDTGKSGGT
jgi:hypothetical protein